MALPDAKFPFAFAFNVLLILKFLAAKHRLVSFSPEVLDFRAGIANADMLEINWLDIVVVKERIAGIHATCPINIISNCNAWSPLRPHLKRCDCSIYTSFVSCKNIFNFLMHITNLFLHEHMPNSPAAPSRAAYGGADKSSRRAVKAAASMPLEKRRERKEKQSATTCKLFSSRDKNLQFLQVFLTLWQESA